MEIRIVSRVFDQICSSIDLLGGGKRSLCWGVGSGEGGVGRGGQSG